ncbi:MAG: sugar O-acetyltransferase [Sporolactobacillus sp.]
MDDNRQKMEQGEIYDPNDPEILEQQEGCLKRVAEYNRTLPGDPKRNQLLANLFKSCGHDCYFEPPLHANWGSRTTVGNKVYANFNLTLVDDGTVQIGNYVMFGPNVTLATANHPLEPKLRRQQLQFNKPIVIKDNVWIGANAVILSGVTIGENSVIGAGSVVTHSVPANRVAVGVPARIIREIADD